MHYATSITLHQEFTQAVSEVKEALKRRGFGTLTEIDVQATLKEKLGEEMEPYLILGACNPSLAHRALEAERQIGALLPCNVVVRRSGDTVVVDALDPAIMVGVTANPALEPVAQEAARLIGEALDELADADAGRTGPS